MIKELTGHFLHRARYLRCFCRADGGATAVEFAIIGPAFIATLVAVLQVCVVLFAQMAIQNAAHRVHFASSPPKVPSFPL